MTIIALAFEVRGLVASFGLCQSEQSPLVRHCVCIFARDFGGMVTLRAVRTLQDMLSNSKVREVFGSLRER